MLHNCVTKQPPEDGWGVWETPSYAGKTVLPSSLLLTAAETASRQSPIWAIEVCCPGNFCKIVANFTGAGR